MPLKKGDEKMKKKNLLLIAIILSIFIVFTGCGNKAEKAPEEGKTVTIVDNAGRSVTLPYPIESAVVSNRYNSELIRAIGAIDKVIAVDLNTAQDREFWSEFDPDNTIGKGQRELNYEKIIELAPQVLITPKNGSWEEDEKALEPFGIKVVVISGYDTFDFKNQVTTLGTIFGAEEGASNFIKWYDKTANYISSKVTEKDKKSVYLETLTENSTSFEGDFFYGMVVLSQGEHIFQTRPEGVTGTVINPEDVVLKDPQVIVKIITPDHALSGTGLYEAPKTEQSERVISEIKNRPAWDEIDAVKNDQVYVMSQFGHGGASKLVGAAYMAKWIYGDLLPELDPVEIERQWMEDLQGFRSVEGHFYPLPK